MSTTIGFGFAVALGVGLLIGLERSAGATFSTICEAHEAALRDWLGETGIAAGAVVAGFVDTNSAAASVTSLAASARMTPLEAVLPILAAMTSKVAAKIAMAFGAGFCGFALRITPGPVARIDVAWAAAPTVFR